LGEIRTIQALRGLACLMVVVYHAIQAGWGEAAIRAWPNGAAGVDLFFVISGVVMMRSSRGLTGSEDPARRFLARRLRRIVPLYWLMTALKLALLAASPALARHSNPDAWNVAASLLFIPSRDALGVVRPVLPVGWTLEFEMLFYALFAGALACRARPLWITPILAFLAFAGFWRRPDWPAPLILANGMVLEFAAGMAIAGLDRRRGGAKWPGLALFVACVVLCLAPGAGPWRFLVWGVPAATAVAAALALEPRAGPVLPPWMLGVGDASFAIYLVHPFVIACLATHGRLGAGAAVPLSLVAGVALHRFVDAPMQLGMRGGGRKMFFFEKKNQKTFEY
jgi:peptidoglycan/LPS O-acetylase OafA/YrhL